MCTARGEGPGTSPQMPAFQDFMRALAEQMVLANKAPVVAGRRGTPEMPVAPNMESRRQLTRGSAISGTGVPADALRDVPDERRIELENLYGNTRRALDERDKLEAQVKAQGGQFIVIPEYPVIGAGQYTRPEDDPLGELGARETDIAESQVKRYPHLRLLPSFGDYQDQVVAERGWKPEDFDGMSEAEAAGLIASQLKARRIRQMGEFSPDFIDTLPVY